MPTTLRRVVWAFAVTMLSGSSSSRFSSDDFPAFGLPTSAT
jgi:hypothetical protein